MKLSKVEPLKYITQYDNIEGVSTTIRVPNQKELMAKINEVITKLNILIDNQSET